MRTSRWLPWITLSIAALIYGCGYPVCVGPLGVGGNCYDQDADSSGVTTGTLTITAPKSALAQGEIVTFTVTGGVSPYDFDTPSKGTITAEGVYTAPNESGVAVRIEVEDASNATAATAITIN